ncbi:MAG: hypothetical protein LBK82_00460, partial [Planctomycetaceae bacterium]|nr:hypothetical protein [Planctomycetaceae bacterium]
LLNKHLTTPPPPVTQRNKNITPEFAALLKMMLAKKPEDRPKSTDELSKMLHSVRIFRRSPIPNDVA